MNKLLATSALVAAGLVASAGVASAQAPAPIQVVVGGYMIQYFGGASNDDGVLYASGNGRGSGTATVSSMNKMSQQSDTEIWVGGRTTLSNGIVVGFDVQFEGNSNNIQGTTAVGDVIDESYMFLDGAFGRLVVGSENDAPYIMNYGAPAMGASSAFGANEAIVTSWVHQPANVSFNTSTAPVQQGDAQRVTYFTPRFSGFQLGVSYTPNSLEDINGMVDKQLTTGRTNGWAPSANYVNTLGSIRIAASAGLSYYPAVDGAATTTSAGNDIKDWSTGLQLGMGDFTVGGGYRVVDSNLAATDGSAWSVGAAYQSGPIAVTLSHLQSVANGTAAVGDDKVKQSILGASYTMGPGVDLIGAIFNVSYKDEGGAAANKNSGSGGVVGIRLMF